MRWATCRDRGRPPSAGGGARRGDGSADDLPAIRSDLADALLAAASHARRVEPGRAVGYLRGRAGATRARDLGAGRRLGALGRALLEIVRLPGGGAKLREAQAWLDARREQLAAAELAVPLSAALRRPATDADANRRARTGAARPRGGSGAGSSHSLPVRPARPTKRGSGDRAGRCGPGPGRAELGLPEPALARIVRGIVARSSATDPARRKSARDRISRAGGRRPAAGPGRLQPARVGSSRNTPRCRTPWPSTRRALIRAGSGSRTWTCAPTDWMPSTTPAAGRGPRGGSGPEGSAARAAATPTRRPGATWRWPRSAWSVASRSKTRRASWRPREALGSRQPGS